MNTMGFTTHIGTGKLRLKEAVPALNQKINITIPLVNRTKGEVKQGQVAFSMQISGAIPQKTEPAMASSQAAAAAPSTNDSKPVIAQSTDPKAITTASVAESNKNLSPIGTIEKNAVKEANTSTAIPAIAAPTKQSQEDPKIALSSDLKAVDDIKIEPTISKPVVADDKALTTANPMPSSQPIEANKPKEISMEPTAMKAMSSDVPVVAGPMTLKLSSLKAVDLADTGSAMDKQDPLLSIKIGNQIFKTIRQKDAGTNATFSETFEIDISAKEYQSNVPIGEPSASSIAAHG